MSLRPAQFDAQKTTLAANLHTRLSLQQIGMLAGGQVKREHGDSGLRQRFVLVAEFEQADVMRGLGPGSVERHLTLRYEKTDRDNFLVNAALMQNAGPLMKTLLEDAAEAHKYNSYRVVSKPFLAPSDVSACEPLPAINLSYSVPFESRDFQNDIIDNIVALSSYWTLFRNFECGSPFEMENNQVRYHLL